MSPYKLLPLLALPFLAACSDDRATYEIDGTQHSLTLIRIQQFPWERKGEFAVVAAHLPDCTRRHAMDPAGMEIPVEVFSPGNSAWILRQGRHLYAVETRTCEGFARLDAEPEGGLGTPVGSFRSADGEYRFVPAPVATAPATAAPAANDNASPASAAADTPASSN